MTLVSNVPKSSNDVNSIWINLGNHLFFLCLIKKNVSVEQVYRAIHILSNAVNFDIFCHSYRLAVYYIVEVLTYTLCKRWLCYSSLLKLAKHQLFLKYFSYRVSTKPSFDKEYE